MRTYFHCIPVAIGIWCILLPAMTGPLGPRWSPRTKGMMVRYQSGVPQIVLWGMTTALKWAVGFANFLFPQIHKPFYLSFFSPHLPYDYDGEDKPRSGEKRLGQKRKGKSVRSIEVELKWTRNLAFYSHACERSVSMMV